VRLLCRLGIHRWEYICRNPNCCLDCGEPHPDVINHFKRWGEPLPKLKRWYEYIR
jgi:hypothetical protein